MEKKENAYDWLGHGYYFWESNYDRAFDFACEKRENPNKFHTKINNPAVLGAVIDLGFCFDLLDNHNLTLLQDHYKTFEEAFKMYGSIPKNKTSGGTDLLLRYLDCAVIESFHKFIKSTQELEYDSVRGVFWEGDELYPTAGFKNKNHIQICIRNPNCIKGFFIPLEENDKHKFV